MCVCVCVFACACACVCVCVCVTHLHSLLDAVGGSGVLRAVQVGEEHGVDQSRLPQPGLA